MNEVEIHVTAKDDTRSTFEKIKASAAAMKARMKIDVDLDKDRLTGMVGKLGETVVSGLSGIGSTLSQAMGPALLAGLTIPAAAALAAAIPLAFGGGVLAIGIIGALKDPKIEGALGKLGDRAKGIFDKFSEPFKGPVLRAINTFGDALDDMAPTLEGLGETVAPIIDKLAPAVADFAKNILPGIEKAVEASMPLFDVIADKLPEIGDALAKFLEALTDEEAMEAAERLLSTLLDGLSAILPILGKTIAWLARFYSTMVDFWKDVADATGDAISSIRATLSRWGSALSSAANRVRDFISNAISFFGRLGSGVRRGINSAISAATSALSNLRSRVIGFFSGAGNWLYSAGRRIISGLASGVRSMGGVIRSAIGAMIPDALERFVPGFAHGGIIGAASGGARSGLTMVGEHGRELVKLPAGSRVYPNSATEDMLASTGQKEDSGPTEIRFSGDLDSALASLLMRMFKTGLITIPARAVA